MTCESTLRAVRDGLILATAALFFAGAAARA
jgi:hypothetical protein